MPSKKQVLDKLTSLESLLEAGLRECLKARKMIQGDVSTSPANHASKQVDHVDIVRASREAISKRNLSIRKTASWKFSVLKTTGKIGFTHSELRRQYLEKNILWLTNGPACAADVLEECMSWQSMEPSSDLLLITSHRLAISTRKKCNAKIFFKLKIHNHATNISCQPDRTLFNNGCRLWIGFNPDCINCQSCPLKKSKGANAPAVSRRCI